MGAYAEIISMMGGSGLPGLSDADAQAFVTAGSITDPTQRAAVNQFVIDLKAASLWTKMKYVYPLMGGTALAHKFNLKDPIDADANFRLTFGSDVTHGANGISTSSINGTNNIVDTHFVPSVEFADDSASYGVMCHTAPNVNSAPGGSFYGSQGAGSTNHPRFTRSTTATLWLCGMHGGTRTNTVTTFTEFLSVSNDDASNTAQTYINGSAAGATFSTSTGGRSTSSHYLLRYNNNGTVNGSCQFTMKFAFASTQLNATEQANLSTAVLALQTALGR